MVALLKTLSFTDGMVTVMSHHIWHMLFLSTLAKWHVIIPFNLRKDSKSFALGTPAKLTHAGHFSEGRMKDTFVCDSKWFGFYSYSSTRSHFFFVSLPLKILFWNCILFIAWKAKYLTCHR